MWKYSEQINKSEIVFFFLQTSDSEIRWRMFVRSFFRELVSSVEILFDQFEHFANGHRFAWKIEIFSVFLKINIPKTGYKMSLNFYFNVILFFQLIVYL